MKKEPVKAKDKVEVDLSKPIDKSKILYSVVPCFGVGWDCISRECSVCAANDVCAIFTQEEVKKQAKELEKKEGWFLDSTDFYEVDTKVLKWLEKHSEDEVTSEDLIKAVGLLAKCRDEVSNVLFVKRLVKSTPGLSIKGGIVKYR